MELSVLEIAISLSALLLALYSYARWNYDYWEKRGVPGPRPTVPFGNVGDVLRGSKPLVLKLQELYEANSENPYVGFFVGRTPILLAKDPELIKHVLVKDFHVFHDRGLRINEEIDPLAAHLFNIGGDRWRVLRQKLTPVFTTGKLKHMFHLMTECAENFEQRLKLRVAANPVIECRDYAARYSTDVIGSCAFGIQTQALADEDSDFRRAGRKIFEPSFWGQIKRFMRESTPGLFSLLRLSIIEPAVTKFFINTMRETMALRKREKIVRNDFVDVLMDIPKDDKVDGFEWTDNLLTAQAFVFFAAGFETSSTTVSFALWELSRVPEIQERLRQEVVEYDRKNDGRITYEAVNEMKYLDMVVKETLRKNPVLPVLIRRAMRDYVLPGTNVTLPAGQSVQISAYALQRDPKFYPNPMIFDPERFTDEAKRARHPMTFLPFGDGPKNCIGARFGYYQVKLALIKVLKNFRVHPTTKIDEPYVVDKKSTFLSPVGGIALRFERLSD